MNFNRDYQLFEVGDVLYRINKNKLTGPFKITITEVVHHKLGHYTYHYGKEWFFARKFCDTYFETEEEAKKELEKAKKIKNKKELLKAYEVKLNKELGLDNHIIVK